MTGPSIVVRPRYRQRKRSKLSRFVTVADWTGLIVVNIAFGVFYLYAIRNGWLEQLADYIRTTLGGF